MHPSIQFALLAVASFLVFKIVTYIQDERYHRAQAKKLGCQAPASSQGRDPFGLENLIRMLHAFRSDNLPYYVKERGDEVEKEIGRRVTTSSSNFCGTTYVITDDPMNLKAFLSTQFKDFGLGEQRLSAFVGLLGQGIFASNGKQWEHARALLRPQFARAQISELDLEERHVQNLFSILKPNSDGWVDATELKPLFLRYTLDTATEFLFGQSVESQLSALPGYTPKHDFGIVDPKTFAAAFEGAQYVCTLKQIFGPLQFLAETPSARRCYRQCHEFIDRFVDLALSKPPAEKDTTTSNKYVFLDALVAETRDPQELRFQLINILLAGRDTTATLLSFIIIVLIQHPLVFQKLRSIILEEFGTYSNPKDITFSSLKSCSYLQWVLNETLRLYPLLPYNDRVALRDTTLPRGGGPHESAPIYVRKGTVVEYCTHIVHRRKDLWGDDADEFRPERWDGRKTGFEYIPFNAGPRICIGQQLALTSAGYVVVRFLQRFEKVEGVGGEWDLVRRGGYGSVRQSFSLVASPAMPVRVRMKVAEE